MKKMLKGWKRVVAFLLVICIIISNSNLTVPGVSAEEPEKGQYTFVCKIKESGEKISDSEVKVEIFDGDNKEIEKADDAYELEKGKKYKYKITSTSPKFKGSSLKIEDTFSAGADKEIPLFIPPDMLNIEMGNKECYKGESISMSAPDDWNLNWLWESDNEKVAKVEDNGKVTAVGEGTATITKTSKSDSKIKASAQVTVVASLVEKQTVDGRMETKDNGTVNCKPKFVVIIKEETVELDIQSVKVWDGKKELTPSSEGKYDLVLGQQ